MKFCNFCPPNGTNKCKPAGYNFDERVFKIMSNDFKKIARKIKRRRIIVSAIIILVTLVATTSVLNYKASQGNEEPFIALGTNYEFGDDNDVESVFLRATRDSLCIKVFHGKDPECEANILYATPEIFQISKAESMLNFIVKMIDESTYTMYDVDIECVAQAIKKEYDA